MTRTSRSRATSTAPASWSPRSAPDVAELFTYPGDKHLFTDSSLPSYDAAATRLVLDRSLAFLDRLG